MVSHSTVNLTPATNSPRPTLPIRHANPKFAEDIKLPPERFQEILREGQTIIVGRLKIATPTHPGHAFILRRYDTGAISLTTMFKAAYPTAPEESEKAEAAWIRANYDISGANGATAPDGTPKLRLNGTWVPSSLAKQVAPAYGLESIILSLLDASPDPKQEYRKSTKNSPGTAPQLTVPDVATPSTPKRRRAISPATMPTLSEGRALPTRSSPRKAGRQNPRSTTPAPQDAAHTPGGSDETAVDNDADDEPEVPGPDMAQDIEDQKVLIADLKARRAAAGTVVSTPANSRKRQEIESPPLTFNFDKEPEVGERSIITRRRMQLQPHQKAAAWGTLAFAVGLGAISLLPNLFS